MAILPRLTAEDLLARYLEFPENVRHDLGGSSFTISLFVVTYYLGERWVEKHLSPDQPTPGFLRIKTGEQTDEAWIRSFKKVDLAELLYNLQNVEGFNSCVERIKTEQKVESGLAELDFGRMLYINDHRFRFISATGIRGSDYDFEITLGKWVICADVKCKLSDKNISKNIIANELAKSRNQLPSDKPGMFFIKVPQHWMETSLYEQLLIQAAVEFLQTTRRVVSIKYYIAPFVISNGHLGQGHRFAEIHNPRNRFDSQANWKLFHYVPRSGGS
jgi:hypothetical protein